MLGQINSGKRYAESLSQDSEEGKASKPQCPRAA